MKIEITPEMLEAARARRAEQERMQAEIEDPGAQNICIACE